MPRRCRFADCYQTPLAEMDQQAILAMASYCNHFTGMTIYLLGRRHLSECWSR